MDSWRNTSVISNRIISNKTRQDRNFRKAIFRNQKQEETQIIIGTNFSIVEEGFVSYSEFIKNEGTHSCHCWSIDKRGCML